MSSKTFTLSPELHQYLVSVSVREPEVLANLRAETAPIRGAGMQISMEQGQFMSFLIQLIGAKKTLEVGTFTGYSSLVVALALPEDGQIYACDVSEEWTNLARKYWQEAGVAHKITLTIAPALETLGKFLADKNQVGTFDFAFIDADKENYEHYYEAALQLLRKGGVIAIDNTLWGGRVADPTAADDSTRALRALNQKLHTDERISLSQLPIGDGLTLCLKR
jgi:predicted O-methyltransferase YrrM